MRVLIVDDEVDLCSMLSDAIVDELSAAVTVVHTGIAGAQMISCERFDLALIDVRLPDCSGVALAVIAANENVPVLMMSGHPTASDRFGGFGCPFLPKPFDLDWLFEEVATAILHGAENVRRVRAAANITKVNLQTLTAVIEPSRRLLRESGEIPTQIRRPDPEE